MRVGRLVIAAGLAAGLVACDDGGRPKPKSTEATDNPAFSYEVLFTRRGCEVGRFSDYRPVYVVLCRDGSARADYEYPYGKGQRGHVAAITPR